MITYLFDKAKEDGNLMVVPAIFNDKTIQDVYWEKAKYEMEKYKYELAEKEFVTLKELEKFQELVEAADYESRKYDDD